MRVITLLASAMAVTSSAAAWVPVSFFPLKPTKHLPSVAPDTVVPGYPTPGTKCLSDDQANFIAEQFRQILASTDRVKAEKIANALLADEYTETSDSISILEGHSLETTLFNKDAFIAGVTFSPAVKMSTIRVFHDCNKISWQWRVTDLGRNKYPVKGINVFVVKPKTGVILSTDVEFNSVAWGIDINAIECTFNPPPSPV